MTSHLAEAVNEQIGHAERLYHRLVLVVGAEGTGKTTALRDLTDTTGAPLINVGVELSRRLLDLAEWQRSIRVAPLLDRIVAETGSGVILLDNIELLFDLALHQDPLLLLRGLSRRRTIVASWNGSMEEGHIQYAVPGHLEHRRCPVDGVLVVDAEAAK